MFQLFRRWLGLAKPLQTPNEPAAARPAEPPERSPATGPSLKRSPPPDAPAEVPGPSTVGMDAYRPRIGSWACLLHDVDIAEVGRMDVDLVVVDNGADRYGGHVFDAAAVRRMSARAAGGRKRMLCYLSIGEAEAYRYYWRQEWTESRHKPEWLDHENPDWKENFKVRYWHPEWQRLLFGSGEAYLDRIVAAGFDGVYLDILDAYTAYEKERPSARQDMIDLVVGLATYARRLRPGFLVVAQNGEALLTSPEYRAVLSAIAREDLYFGAETDETANSTASVEASLGQLALARRDGIPVLVIEYLTEAGKIRKVRNDLAHLGFTPCFIRPEP